MRKSWIAAFTILAVAALLIPATPLFAPRSGPSREAPKSIPFSSSKEQKLKLTELQHDMDATALLMTSESAKDFRHILKASGHSSSAASDGIAALMKEHSHFSYINWMSGSKSIHRGTVPESANGAAKTYLSEAAAKLKEGNGYESKSFTGKNGSRFVVLGVPDAQERGSGVIGILKQDIVGQVELHQKRNLRLIPYPAEGNYRIESVAPNSTRDITVRNGEDNGNASHYHIRDVVVHFVNRPTGSDLEKIKRDVNAESIQQIGDTYVFRSRSMETEGLMNYFKANWKTEYTEPHYLYLTNETADNATIVPNDALYSQYQWNLPSIETEKGWTVSKGDEGVIIAVLDTGVQSNHPDLKDKLIEGTNIVSNNSAPDDDVGHGTHVAGIIGASVNNGEGVAGVSWYNKIMPIKVLDSSGAGSTYSVAQGIIWAVDHGAKVINMSLGNYAQADFLHDAIKYAYERDVVLIAASGNDNTERPGYPAAYPEVFAVAATNNNKEKASFSNYGDYIDVAAPGDSIASTYPGSQYAALSGTSMASPHVAALAGLIRSVNPDLSNEEVMEIMRVSARDLGTDGKDIYFGYGEIDVNKALNAATGYGGTLQNFPQKVKRRLAQAEE
ncbi:S8 family peptidase [Paenibacillus sp. LHD-117]|uniref:S8 family peptidase n=1 Tax=Paenibacillus sp. LHD-117 TaxID=3071412 RepID=UPI0027DFA751|nr:S8 family peptidase [Paenibacillus sp. LHD-117]MDQ6421099.1 S8 family peptidase [Paenibacillus sp. LHD-117]